MDKIADLGPAVVNGIDAAARCDKCSCIAEAQCVCFELKRCAHKGCQSYVRKWYDKPDACLNGRVDI